MYLLLSMRGRDVPINSKGSCIWFNWYILKSFNMSEAYSAHDVHR